MKIYNFTDEFRSRCKIDLKNYVSLDEYLLRNKPIKQLVYGYLKFCKGDKVKLSYLNEVFENTKTLRGLNSKKQKSYLESDLRYRKVYEKYIKVPEIWVCGVNQLQPYLFDSKHLLSGEYQSHANYGVNKMINSTITNYVMNIGNVRGEHDEHLNFYNEWFVEKRRIERNFYEKLLSLFNFDSHLYVRYYWKFIEIYDSTTNLTLQIEVKPYGESDIKILMPDDAQRNTFNKRNNLAFKFLTRNHSVFNLYGYLVNSLNLDEINEFTENLQKVENRIQFKVLKANVTNILEDLRDNNIASSFDSDFINTYLICYDSIEQNTIHYSEKNKLLRYYRRIKRVNEKDICLFWYSLPKKIDEAAKHLVMSGFVNISPQTYWMDEKEYQFIATDTIESNYALQFLRTPLIDVVNEMSEYNDYEKQLIYDIDILKEKNLPIKLKDSRKYDVEHKYYNLGQMNFFDYYLYDINPTEFQNNNEIRIDNIKARIINYKNKHKNTLVAVNKIIEDRISKST